MIELCAVIYSDDSFCVQSHTDTNVPHDRMKCCPPLRCDVVFRCSGVGHKGHCWEATVCALCVCVCFRVCAFVSVLSCLCFVCVLSVCALFVCFERVL